MYSIETNLLVTDSDPKSLVDFGHGRVVKHVMKQLALRPLDGATHHVARVRGREPLRIFALTA